MSEEHEYDFATGDALGSDTFPIAAGSVKKGGFCMLKGFPCKVTDYSTAKVGKHGSAKAKIIGMDIFTGNKYEEVCPTSHNMECPVVKRMTYQCIDIQNGYTTLLDEAGNTREDIVLPETGNLAEVGEKISALFAEGKAITCVVQSACKIEAIVECKEMN